MDFTSHSQLFRKYWGAEEHASSRFYALTTLFPSISRYKRSHTRADRRTAIRTTTPFSRQLTFSPTNDPFPGFFQRS